MQSALMGSEAGGSSKGSGMLWLSAIVAALGSFLFGFDTAVISGTTEALKGVYSLTDNLLGFTVASALIGTLFGAVIVGRPSDWWGRKRVLTLLSVLFVISAFGCAYAQNWHMLLFFRWLGGVAVGGTSVVSPVYITEIAPARSRGLLVMVSQLNIVLGILAAYFSNYLTAYWLGPEHPQAWRWMFGVMAVPSFAFLFASMIIPESPRWLVKKGRVDAARGVLSRFGHADPDKEAAEITQSLAVEMAGTHQHIFQRKYLKPLLLAAMIAAFNQLDGINAVIYYTADIFRLAGYDKTSSLMQSVVVGLTNLVMTVVAMALIDRLGRKKLLLIGSVTFVLSHLLAAWAFHTHADGWLVIVAMMGIAGSHSYSQGAVVWVLINELLPNAVRASGSSAVCFMMWTLCAAVSWIFPVIAGKSAAVAFGFFAVMMVAQFFIVLKYLPETKGVSLEDLEKKLVAK